MLSDNLIALRKQAGWSQETLAEALAVSRQTISKYETGTAEPDLTRLRQLTELFHVSYDDLLGDGRPAPTTAAVIGGTVTIRSALTGQLAAFDRFTIGTVLFSRKRKCRLVGSLAGGSLLAEPIALADYATREAAEAELTAIQAAIARGATTYDLRRADQ